MSSAPLHAWAPEKSITPESNSFPAFSPLAQAVRALHLAGAPECCGKEVVEELLCLAYSLQIGADFQMEIQMVIELAETSPRQLQPPISSLKMWF